MTILSTYASKQAINFLVFNQLLENDDSVTIHHRNIRNINISISDRNLQNIDRFKPSFHYKTRPGWTLEVQATLYKK